MILAQNTPLLASLLPALGILLLLVCSALISGSEVAFFSLSPAQQDSIAQGEHSSDEKIKELLESPNKHKGPQMLLAVILIANNFVNIAIILLSGLVLPVLIPVAHEAQFGISAEAINLFTQVGLVTFLLVLFGEVIPKVYATNYNLSLARRMAVPLLFCRRLFGWLGEILIATTNFIQRKVQSGSTGISVDELGQALELTQNEGDDSEEHKILQGIVNFGSIDVKQIMTPRMDIEAFRNDTSWEDLIVDICDTGYSRVPVYDETLDNIEGILYLKDLLGHIKEDNVLWREKLRKPFIVPENKKIDDLLREFQEKKIHLAIVVDEYGGTSGLVSLEDVLEEIVGEITDEFDDQDLQYSKLDDHNYVFEGKMALIDMYRILDIDGSDYEAAKGEADTLAGFVIEQAGKIPQKGEKIKFREVTFTIEASDKRKIKRIKYSRETDAHE